MRRHSLLSIIHHYLPIVWFILIWAVFFLPWRFQVNDDVIMMWLVSGAYTGQTETYALFIHPLLSYFLAQCYTVIPQFNWYGFVMICTNGVSAYLLSNWIFSRPATDTWKCFFLLFTFAIFLHLSLFVQFTTVAGFAALASLLYCTEFDRQPKGISILAFALFLAATMIRWESVVLIGLGFSMFLICFYRKAIIPWKKWISFFAAFFILIIGKSLYENHCVDQDFLRFDRLRAAVIDHPMFVEDILRDQVKEDSDWFYFGRWMFEELPIDNKLLIDKKKELDQRLFSTRAVASGINRILRIQSTELFKSMLMGCMLVLFCFLILPAYRKLVFGLAWGLFYLIFNHFYYLQGRVNFLFFLVFLVPLLFFPRLKINRMCLKTLSYVVGFLICIHFWNFYQEYLGRNIIGKELKSLIERRESDTPIYLEGVLEYHFLDHYSYENPVPFLIQGWISRSPFQQRANQRFHFEDQSKLQEFGLLSFRSSEPLEFPDYMERISSKFIQNQEIKTEYLRLEYYSQVSPKQ